MSQQRLFTASLIAAFTVVFAVHFMDVPGSVPRFLKLSGGEKLFDVAPSFSGEEIQRRVASFGEEGRQSYAFRNMTVDVILPLSLLPFLVLLMRKALASLRPSFVGRKALAALPFVYVVFDLMENVVVLALLANYPQPMDAATTVLPYITSIKRLASLLALFLPLGIMATLFIRGKRQRMPIIQNVS